METEWSSQNTEAPKKFSMTRVISYSEMVAMLEP